MLQKVDDPVSVDWLYDHTLRRPVIKTVGWNGRTYSITRLGLHHTYRTGRTLYHVFSIESPTLFFRLVFNTDNLHWTLEEIADGQPT
jgi:hypothetical protein